MNEDDFSEIKRRIRDLRHQYPNSQESVELHGRLVRYKHDPVYQDRIKKALSMPTKVGFKPGRRIEYY